jgi:hypothetical protein
MTGSGRSGTVIPWWKFKQKRTLPVRSSLNFYNTYEILSDVTVSDRYWFPGAAVYGMPKLPPRPVAGIQRLKANVRFEAVWCSKRKESTLVSSLGSCRFIIEL